MVGSATITFRKEMEHPDLIELLVCPRCHGSLKWITEPEGLACETCKLFYAFEDGLPNMLIDEAKPWPLRENEAS